MKAVRIHKTGGPEVLQLDDIELPPPSADQVRVRHTVIGVNFIDTYHRTGLYRNQLPLTLGMEGAGIVEKVGPKVKDLKVGDPKFVNVPVEELTSKAYARPMAEEIRRGVKASVTRFKDRKSVV